MGHHFERNYFSAVNNKNTDQSMRFNSKSNRVEFFVSFNQESLKSLKKNGDGISVA